MPKKSRKIRPNQGPPERDRAAERLAASHFVLVALGSRELLGVKPSWQAIQDRLRHYSLQTVLELLGRVSLFLNRFSELEERQQAQITILRGLLGAESRVEKNLRLYVLHHLRRGETLEWVLFHERQLLNMAKAAFLCLPATHEGVTEDPELFAEAMLMANNLLEEGSASLAHHDVGTEDGQREWEQFLFANLHYAHRGIDLHEIARGYVLYHTSPTHLQAQDGTYLDVRAYFERLIGMPADVYWGILKAISSYWQAMDLQHGPDRPYVLDPFDYLCRSGIYTEKEVRQFLHFFASEATEFAQEIRNEYSFSDIRPYSVLPFAKRPMILFEDRVVVPSIHLLHEKLVRGTHHLFLDPLLVPDRKNRRIYLDFLGRIFESYVEALLTRTYGAALGEFIPESLLKAHTPGKVCDGAIRVGDVVILIEAKAKLFPMATREWRDWDAYLAKLKDIYVGSSEQIQSTIDAIRSGRFASIGLIPKKIRVYLPLVVTLDPSASNHLLYRRITDLVVEAGLLNAPDVRPLQVMDIGELEMWETAVGIGKSMHRYLEEKASTPESAHMTFGNYMVTRRLNLGSRKNPYLAKVYDELTERILTDIRSRRAETTRSPRG